MFLLLYNILAFDKNAFHQHVFHYNRKSICQNIMKNCVVNKQSSLIKLISELLLHFYKRGWDPLTPVTMGNTEKTIITTICFERRQFWPNRKASIYSVTSSSNIDTPKEILCCSFVFDGTVMTLHSLPSTVLAELVNTCHNDIVAVSAGVMSIISDYMTHNLPVIDENTLVIKFRPRKKGSIEDKSNIIACLSKAGRARKG